MEEVTLGIALIAGLLSFLSPCVLPLVPAYVSYMGGRAVHQVAIGAGEVKAKRTAKSRLAILIHGLAFVLGFTVVFVSLGIATTAFVRVLGTSAIIITEIIARAGGVLIIIFGLHFMGALRDFFAWLKKNPSYLVNFPTILLLVGIVMIALIWFSAQTVLTLGIGSLLVRMLALVVVVGLIGYLFTKGFLRGVVDIVYAQREALGALPTSIVVAVLGCALIIWSFVDIIVGIPVAAVFLVVLFVSNAFDDPQSYWTGIINKVETALYADTRRDIDPTDSASLGGSFLMGVTFSAGWTPCIGPIYGAILQLGLQGEVISAAPLLLAYSLGLGIPFLLTAGLLDVAQSVLRRVQRYMGRIELFTGFLLIFIGLLVASGQLQSLSQNLSPEQTEFSINIEECGTSVAQGRIQLGEFGACMNDTLHPIAINQGTSEEFTAGKSETAFAFTTSEAEVIDIEITRIDGIFPAQVTISDADGNEIATSDTITQLDERTYRIINDAILPVAGRYTVVATRTDGNTEDFTFRLSIRRDTTEDDTVEVDDSATSSNADEILIGLELGNQAPDFTVSNITGEQVTLSDMRGQVVLINFWGTWCGPCRREMPDFQEFYDIYNEQGFDILALATDGDTVEDVIEFRDEFTLTFPLLIDENNEVMNEYAITSRPSTIIVDQNGVIVFKHFGLVSESQITEVLDELLEG